MDDKTSISSRKAFAFVAALLFAVAGATATQISGIATDGYAIIVNGPIYLAICGLVLLATAAYSCRQMQLPQAAKLLLIVGLSLVSLWIASKAGMFLGDFINSVYLKWPVSDHHGP